MFGGGYEYRFTGKMGVRRVVRTCLMLHCVAVEY